MNVHFYAHSHIVVSLKNKTGVQKQHFLRNYSAKTISVSVQVCIYNVQIKIDK